MLVTSREEDGARSIIGQWLWCINLSTKVGQALEIIKMDQMDIYMMSVKFKRYVILF